MPFLKLLDELDEILAEANASMNPEQIAAKLNELLEHAQEGAPARLTVEQGQLIQFAIGVIRNMAAELKALKEPKP